MFYDVTALFAVSSMFHLEAKPDIAWLKHAPETVRVFLDPTDSDAVYAYFTHSDRAEAVIKEVSLQLRLIQKLQLRYIYVDDDEGIVFRTEPPRAQWLESCCICLEILTPLPAISMSGVTDETQSFINLSLRRILKPQKDFDKLPNTLRVYMDERFFIESDNKINPFCWQKGKSEPSQIRQTVAWLDRAIRPLEIRGRFRQLCRTSILDSKDVDLKTLRLQLGPHTAAHLAGRPDVYIICNQKIYGFIELKKSAAQVNRTHQAVNYLTALGRVQAHPVFGLMTDLKCAWRFFWQRQVSYRSETMHEITLETSHMKVTSPQTAITLLRALVVYVVQSIRHDSKTEHFGESDCPGDENFMSEPENDIAVSEETKTREQIRLAWFEHFNVRTLQRGSNGLWNKENDDDNENNVND